MFGAFFITGCIADGYTTMPWKHRSAGSNPATQTRLEDRVQSQFHESDAQISNYDRRGQTRTLPISIMVLHLTLTQVNMVRIHDGHLHGVIMLIG